MTEVSTPLATPAIPEPPCSPPPRDGFWRHRKGQRCAKGDPDMVPQGTWKKGLEKRTGSESRVQLQNNSMVNSFENGCVGMPVGFLCQPLFHKPPSGGFWWRALNPQPSSVDFLGPLSSPSAPPPSSSQASCPPGLPIPPPRRGMVPMPAPRPFGPVTAVKC